jgi:hypothetical protein
MAGYMLGQRPAPSSPFATSSSPSMMTRNTLRSGGVSSFSNIRSMRKTLDFIDACPIVRRACPVARNPLGNLVHAALELL